MSKYSTLFLLILASIACFGQQNLQNTRESSEFTYVYPLNEKVVEQLYKGLPLDEKLLTHPVDSFKTGSYYEPSLAPGNYLKVYADQNSLKYTLLEQRSAQLKLLSNGKELQFILLDKKGQAIRDAEVSVNNKAVSYDQKGGVWRAAYPRKDENLVRVFYQGVANYSIIERDKEGKPFSHYSNWFLRQSPIKYLFVPAERLYKRWVKKQYYGRRQRPAASGYLVFNKPFYKPLDTVKFKAYLLKPKAHKPLDLPLQVILNTPQGKSLKLGGALSPHPGAYHFAFPLHDSLKLQLDRTYRIQLKHRNKQYYEGTFEYEEYELKSISFSMRGDKPEHSRKQAQSLYFRALDENGLNVLDGRVELLIRTQSVSGFKKDRVFVPDTLWKHQLKLDALGETRLVLPDSIFPHADLEYVAEATFLNSNNEERDASEHFDFQDEPGSDLEFELKADSLYLSFRDPAERKREVTIRALDQNGDEIDQFRASVPGAAPINLQAAEYEVEGEDVSDWYEFEQDEHRVSAAARRTADSILVSITNPRRIPIWYTVFKGNKVVDRGTTIDSGYRSAWRGKEKATFSYSFIWAGESVGANTEAQFAEKQLQLDVRQPLVVSPRERAEMEVSVRDAKGKAVEGVDLTAFSITSKFDYQVPHIPYFGRRAKAIRWKQELETDEGFSGSSKLAWERWGRELGLDSIAYFRFTHPQKEYKYYESDPDSITQIAPFVVENGEILPVHILYINDRPVYFSRAQQLRRYSFKVEPGLLNLRFRLKDRIIDVAGVRVEKGKRLVISFNADPSQHINLSIAKAPPVLSDAEANVLNRYMISVADTWSPRYATVKGPDNVFLLSSGGDSYFQSHPKLVGPLSYNVAEFQVKGEKPLTFTAEPNYSYTFQPGLIKQKSIDTKYPFNVATSGTTPVPGYKERVLTNRELDSIWTDYLDLRSHTTHLFDFPNKNLGSARLQIRLTEPGDKQDRQLIKSVLLYRNDDPDFLRIYPGRETNLGYLEPGDYRLLLLLKGNRYLPPQHLKLLPSGRNLVSIPFAEICPADSMSRHIGEQIAEAAMGKLPVSNLMTEQIKQRFNEQYLDPAIYTGRITGTVFDKSDKEPLPGVMIKIKGTSVTTVTGIDGTFSLRVPPRGKLVISFVGYNPMELDIEPGRHKDIYLEQSEMQLQEVVVVGYGKREMEQSLQGYLAGADIRRSMTASVSTITVRGLSSAGSAGPLYIVDGIPQENALSQLSPDEIAELNTLQMEAATAIYGARAANGVIIITTKKGKAKAEKEAAEAAMAGQGATLRKNFSDYAFWQPSLRTNTEGKARFSVTFPDDITNWRTFVIAMNGKEQSGYAENSIKAFRPLSATFVSPAFAIAGDRFHPLGKISNYTTEATSLQRQFIFNDQVLLNSSIKVLHSHIDTLQVLAAGSDSLKFRYTLQKASSYTDGEERNIPLFRAGVQETKGVFSSLEGDTTLTLSFDPALGPVTFRAEASVLPVLLDETERLRNYPYLCNEQMASKLKSLLLERKIRAYLGQPFEHDRDIKSLIKKLEEGRRTDGTWGWWKHGETEWWISRHAVEAYVAAAEAKFDIPVPRQELKDYLTYQLSSAKGMDKLDVMLMLEKLGSAVDYRSHIALYERELKQATLKPGLYNQFKLLAMKQKAGMTISIDSLLQHRRQTMFGSLYFGNDSYRLFDNSIQTTILAYQIIKADGRQPDLLRKMRNYFLEQRRDGQWRNTYESSLILETILPDLLKGGSQPAAPSVRLSGALEETVSTFPYSRELQAGAKLTVEKQGDLPIYITGYQQYWNAVPEKVSKDFRVDTRFIDNKGAVLSKLKGGVPVILTAQVQVKADADYVMIEIPIPAGCSYEEKEQSWRGLEIHREYFKHKVSIFCRKLKQGEHSFEIKLMPRYSGDFQLNPAKAEMMYFPVFYGREGMRQVRIGE
ncbi:carboxypeptidase-like regulatory domain-containing protein [Pedobacter sp. SYSU D00535]|uniref:carboxypeptidase-like regulatory domain-containing protein n=1 Tax=Pedobacter sp. SYSU D00535 TaxID=2810308 RepID=UPI001A972806|nr:carboxypeptidase-like regulatory domain-containing protein [Pedobacter sp. SYSU D00535]